jgi:hypothetical protein
MSIEKTELKMLLARNFCEEMEKSQVKARASIKEYKGEARAFLKAEKMLNEQTQKTKQKIMDGKVEADLTDPIQLAKFVVGEMMSLAGEIHNLGNGAITSGIRAEGSVSAWEDAAKLLQDTYEEERRKLEAFRAAMAEHRVRDVGGDLVIEDAVGDNEQRVGGGPPPPRAVGTHPGLSLKALREQATESQRQSGVGPEEIQTAEKKPKKKLKGAVKAAKKMRSMKRGENGASDS